MRSSDLPTASPRFVRALPSLSSLRCFEAVARSGSFTQAGAELNLSRVAVSRAIARFEKSLGVALFSRKGRYVAMTARGERYYRQIVPHMAAMGEATESLRSEDADGELELCFNSAMGVEWLIPRLTEFMRANPDVPLRLRSTPTLANFDEHGYDAAVVIGAEETEFSRTVDLVNEHLMPVLRTPIGAAKLLAERPVEHPRDLLAHDLLHIEESPQIWSDWAASLANHIKDAELSRLVAAGKFRQGPRFDGFSPAYRATLEGAGLAICSVATCARECDRGNLITPLPFAASSVLSYRLVYRAALRNTRGLRRFRAWVREEAEAFERAYVPRFEILKANADSDLPALRRR